MSLYDKVQAALKKDKTIVVSLEEAPTHPGFSQDYLERLGLEKRDLKRLERKGLAIRGYTKNRWVSGETLPDGSVVPENLVMVGPGHRVRWLLIAGGSTYVEVKPGAMSEVQSLQEKGTLTNENGQV